MCNNAYAIGMMNRMPSFNVTPSYVSEICSSVVQNIEGY